MRRTVFVGILSAMVLVLAGCPTQPPGYRPPTVESIEISPQPATPGDTLTVLVEARDDQGVTGAAARNLTTPSNTSPATKSCPLEISSLSPEGDDSHVLITVTCKVPTYASNGTWRLDVHLSDWTSPGGYYPGRTTRIPFEVVGGNDDRQPPQLLHYEIAPAIVDQETTFTLSARLRDEALPVTVGQGGSSSIFRFAKLFAQHSNFRCTHPTFTPVSSTEVDMAVACRPYSYDTPGRAEVGLHRAGMSIRDALGHESTAEMFVDVVPAGAG